MGTRDGAWTTVGCEEVPWKSRYDDDSWIPRSRRRKTLGTFRAAVPGLISEATPRPDPGLWPLVSEAGRELARFDAEQVARGYDLPALLLRSESSASSRIERLTSSAGNVAWAEVSHDLPENARLVARNLEAMREALGEAGPITADTVVSVHGALMGRPWGLREEQVWVGGTPYSPHGALFVPPQAGRVAALVDDLCAFSRRDDIDPVVKAACFHGQFETVHPFADGNGRCGRALIHRMLKDDGVCRSLVTPLSAGLLHDVGRYMDAIDAYQGGDVSPLVWRLAESVLYGVAVGRRAATAVDSVMERWRQAMGSRPTGAAARLLPHLVAQPVTSVAIAAKALGVSERQALNVLDEACEARVVSPCGNRRRGRFFQATELLEIVDAVGAEDGLRRALPR